MDSYRKIAWCSGTFFGALELEDLNLHFIFNQIKSGPFSLKHFYENNKFKQYYVSDLDSLEDLKIAESCYEKDQKFIEAIKKLLGESLLKNYNDILDHILDNYDFNDFDFKDFYKFDIMINLHDDLDYYFSKYRMSNAYGMRRILQKNPDSLKNLPNWKIRCNLDSAIEIRFYGFANKLDPIYFVKNFPEFIEDCLNEFDIINFINFKMDEDLPNEEVIHMIKLCEIVSKIFSVDPIYISSLKEKYESNINGNMDELD